MANMAIKFPLFIVFEGIDGAGCTTQITRIKAFLEQLDYPVKQLAQPSSGTIGLLLRQWLRQQTVISPDTSALLFAADRAEQLHTAIIPALNNQTIVLCDRYIWSSIAYQGLDLPMTFIESINSRFPPADLTFYLDLSVEIAAQRRNMRKLTSERFDEDAIQEQVRQNYEKILLKSEQHCWVRIAAQQTQDKVFEDIKKTLTGYLT
jgi:dTMP kinase